MPDERVKDALGQDALQVLLEEASRNVLHAHKCHGCGGLCGCKQVPCEFRPFDRNARGERYFCWFCMEVKKILGEEVQAT